MNARAILLMSCVALMLVTGCGSKASADKPIEEVKAEAAKMDKAALQSMVDSYKDAIAAKEKELEAVREKLKDIKVTEMLSEKAKEIKADIEKVAKSVSALTERMNIYAEELKKKAAGG